MGRRALLNLGLLLLALLLAAFIWLTPGASPKDDLPHITSLSVAEAGSLYLRLPRGEEVVLEKRSGSWMMVDPVNVAANEFLIEGLLGVVEAESHAAFDADGRDLGEYRLDPPLALLRVNGEEIAFGGTEGLNQRRYVHVGGRVHLIDDIYYYRLQTGYTTFVSTRVLPAASRVREMMLPGLSLVRDEEGRWSSTPADALTPDAANELAEAWTHAQALTVEPYLADDAFAADRVRLRDEDGTEFEFLLVAHDSALDLVRPDLGLRYRFADEQLDRLLPAVAAASE